MARILECSRCGAGIGHNDTQCWRCGEPLASGGKFKEAPRPAPGKFSSPGIRDVRDSKPKEMPRGQPAVQPIAEGYNGREKELQDREKELREEMDALEAESLELEKAAQQLEKERLAIVEANRRIRSREDDLDAMAIVVQNALQAAEDYQAGIQVGEERVEQVDRLLQASDDLGPVLEEERKRIRQNIEREMADQLSRIGQLEGELKAAYAQLQAGDARNDLGFSPVDVQGILADVTDQMRPQIGAGLPADLDDRRLLTHIDRLDQLLSGGIPMGGVVLINGPAGSMKTSLTYHVLHNAAAKGPMKGMFLSLEQDRDSLIRQMTILGMPRDECLDHLMIVDLVDLRRSMEGQHGDWRSIIMRYVENVMKESPFTLLALDSLESFMAMSQVEFTRIEVQELFDWFRSLGLTTFVISETPMTRLEREGHMELYVADGVVEIIMKEVGDSHIQRWLRCIKMRGANIDPRYYALMHAGNSFILSVPLMRAPSQYPDE
jgi:KaiC/GvpD/RAD55 family RecA-like ATPase